LLTRYRHRVGTKWGKKRPRGVCDVEEYFKTFHRKQDSKTNTSPNEMISAHPDTDDEDDVMTLMNQERQIIDEIRSAARVDDPNFLHNVQKRAGYLAANCDNLQRLLNFLPESGKYNDHDPVIANVATYRLNSSDLWEKMKNMAKYFNNVEQHEMQLPSSNQSGSYLSDAPSSIFGKDKMTLTTDQFTLLQYLSKHVHQQYEFKQDVGAGVPIVPKPPQLKVFILGGPGVGKTTIMNIFKDMTANAG
jgi:hypothetical protein